MSSAGNGRTVTSLTEGGEDGNGIFPPIVALPILILPEMLGPAGLASGLASPGVKSVR